MPLTLSDLATQDFTQELYVSQYSNTQFCCMSATVKQQSQASNKVSQDKPHDLHFMHRKIKFTIIVMYALNWISTYLQFQ